MRSRVFAVVALLIVASMALAACAPAATPTPETIVQTVMVEGTPQTVVITATPAPVQPTAPAAPEAKVLSLNMGPGDIPTLDPSLAQDTSSIEIIMNTMIGLTVQNEETSALEPGVATKWDVSADGLTYTFNLRNDVPWVKYDAVNDKVVQVNDCDGNPRMVTADDYVYGAMRTLEPANASPYAYVLAFVLAGAQEYNDGTSTDFSTVGIKAVDPNTLTMTFKEPAAYNAEIAGMWVAMAEPKWLIEGDDCTNAAGDRWTETGFIQGFGPFTVKEWVHDSFISVIKNPFWPGQDNIPVAALDEVHWTMLDEQPAFADYEAGNLDEASVPQSEIDRVKSDPILSEELKIFPSLCSYYYGYNTTAPVVNDQRVRLALSEAVDRQSLIDNVLKGGQIPAQWFATPGLAGAPTLQDHPDLGVKYDPTDAKAQLQAYLDENGQTADQVDLTLMFNTSSGHQRIAEAIQAMWKDNLGLNVKLVNQEWKVYLETVKGKDTPQIWRMGWCPDYPDANNYDREVFASGGSSNPVDANGNPQGGLTWKNDTFEQLVVEAAKEMDPAKRVDLYAQAEEILSKTDAVIIPIYWYTSVQVTKPWVTQRTYSVGGQRILYHWDLDMTQKMGGQ